MAERKTIDVAPEGFVYLENRNSFDFAGYYSEAVAEVLLSTSVDQAWHAPHRIPKSTPAPVADGVPNADLNLPEGN